MTAPPERDDEHASSCGDDITLDDKLAVEDMPANYGADEFEREWIELGGYR